MTAPTRTPARARTLAPTRSLAEATRWSRLTGYAVIIAFFGGFGLWSATASLTSSAVAPGVVSPDGHRKTVQHLEGGIVRAIHVHEGDVVEAGQPLVTLEDVQAQAGLNMIRDRFVHLLATEARLIAEYAGAASVTVPPDLTALGEAAHQAMEGQVRLFASRAESLTGRLHVLDQKIAQIQAENAGLERVIAAEQRQLDLIDSDIKTVGDLVHNGLARKPRLLELQREEAEIQASKADHEARIARNEQGMGEARYQALTLEAERRQEVDQQLADTRAELARVRSEMPSRSDMVARTVVTAPLAGTVLNLRTTSVRGVLGAGGPILDIVPAQSGLIINARVAPTDIEMVRPGQDARVMLTAYGQRDMPQVFGRLRSISADRLVDEREGNPYFLAQIEVPPDALKTLGADLELTPGMPADVMIITGHRTVLDYLIRPFLVSLTKSFQQQ